MAADIDIAELPLDRAGPRLKRAREAAGRTLAEVSAATKIPERLLAAIENSQFSALPSRIYAIGFSRSYARWIGLDETAIVDEVRAEIDSEPGSDIAATQAFAPGDPARVPGWRLAIVSALGAVLVIGAVLMFWRSGYNPVGALPSILSADAPSSPGKLARANPGAASRSPALVGAVPASALPQRVTLSALSPGIWVKVYEASGKTLFERMMTSGQTFTVPVDAQAPLIWTARPDALAITIGGKPVAKLSDTQKIIKGVPISAAALLGRPRSPAGTPVTMPLPGPVQVPAATAVP